MCEASRQSRNTSVLPHQQVDLRRSLDRAGHVRVIAHCHPQLRPEDREVFAEVGERGVLRRRRRPPAQPAAPDQPEHIRPKLRREPDLVAQLHPLQARIRHLDPGEQRGRRQAVQRGGEAARRAEDIEGMPEQLHGTPARGPDLGEGSRHIAGRAPIDRAVGEAQPVIGAVSRFMHLVRPLPDCGRIEQRALCHRTPVCGPLAAHARLVRTSCRSRLHPDPPRSGCGQCSSPLV